jgi:hypothetical protein
MDMVNVMLLNAKLPNNFLGWSFAYCMSHS